MRLINIGLTLGIASVLISAYQAWPTSNWNLFREILALVNLVFAVIGIIVCVISLYRYPGKMTKVGIVICAIALVLSIITPNHIISV